MRNTYPSDITSREEFEMIREELEKVSKELCKNKLVDID